MLLLALVVFGVTGWFFGIKAGGIAAAVSLASLIAAQVIPGTAIAIYVLHVLWIGGLSWVGPKVVRMTRKPEDQTAAAQAKRWLKRGKAFGEALWKTMK